MTCKAKERRSATRSTQKYKCHCIVISFHFIVIVIRKIKVYAMLRWFPFRFRFRMGRFRMDASRVRSQIRVRVLLEGGRVVSESSSREGGPEVSGDTKEAHNANARWIICIRSVGGRLRPNANIAPEPHHGRTQEPMRTRRGINSIQYLTSSHSILSTVLFLSFLCVCVCGVQCVHAHRSRAQAMLALTQRGGRGGGGSSHCLA